ncbi:MAG: hypothetical protein R3C53_10925 [Pirellulaceae bacterium]
MVCHTLEKIIDMGRTVAEKMHPIVELLRQDQRYHIESYEFVKDALSYAQDVLRVHSPASSSDAAGEHSLVNRSGEEQAPSENHITGQQLCEAIRQYALEQFGFMAKTVLNSWGVHKTDDFGEIVYNLIRIKHMKKSKTDRREDFNDVFDFSSGFDPVFELADCDDF